MDLYICIHWHRFGISLGIVEADHEPGDHEVIEALGFEYNPDPLYEESIEIVRTDRADIKTLAPSLR